VCVRVHMCTHLDVFKTVQVHKTVDNCQQVTYVHQCHCTPHTRYLQQQHNFPEAIKIILSVAFVTQVQDINQCSGQVCL